MSIPHFVCRPLCLMYILDSFFASSSTIWMAVFIGVYAVLRFFDIILAIWIVVFHHFGHRFFDKFPVVILYGCNSGYIFLAQLCINGPLDKLLSPIVSLEHCFGRVRTRNPLGWFTIRIRSKPSCPLNFPCESHVIAPKLDPLSLILRSSLLTWLMENSFKQPIVMNWFFRTK